jgi:hypothetical protein
MYGLWVSYLPRTAVNMDDLFGESTVNSYNDAVALEAYVNQAEGFEGARMMSKFGPQFQEEMTLTIAQKRWDEVRVEHLMTEYDTIVEQEMTSRYLPNQLNGILLEEGNIEGYYIPYDRPREGDLIWISQFSRMFEIKFVQHDSIFYQGGALQTYDLYVELLQYSQEKLETGDTEIDSIEDLFSGDILRDPITDEAAEDIGIDGEDGIIVDESINPENSDKTADNDLFRQEVDGVVDFSEASPFVKRNTSFKW